MKTSQQGIDLIKLAEGFRAKAYQCSAGVWTVGYGTTRGVTSKTVVTEAEASSLLMQHVAGIEAQLNDLGLNLRQCQFDAIVDFVYNVGFGAFSRSGLLAMVKVNPDSSNIPTEFRKWRLAGGAPNKGLISRREMEIRLYQA
jgi:lysozyme